MKPKFVPYNDNLLEHTNSVWGPNYQDGIEELEDYLNSIMKEREFRNKRINKVDFKSRNRFLI